MKQAIIITLAILLCTACGGLSRRSAKKEITKNMQLPQTESVTLQKRFLKEHIRTEGFGTVCLSFGNNFTVAKYGQFLQDLQTNGYITLKDDDYPDKCNDLYTNVILTDKGKKDLIKEDDGIYTIKLCSIEFGEITGIAEYKEFNAADVHYTLRRTDYTDFGKMVNGNKEQPETIERLANFTKFDNGWRMGK